jgi:hypothetical protein
MVSVGVRAMPKLRKALGSEESNGMIEPLTTWESPGINEPAYYQKMPRSSA